MKHNMFLWTGRVHKDKKLPFLAVFMQKTWFYASRNGIFVCFVVLHHKLRKIDHIVKYFSQTGTT